MRRSLPSLITIEGLPIYKHSSNGRITAIDLNKGTIAWQIAHGETPETSSRTIRCSKA